MASDRNGGSGRVKVLIDTNAFTLPVQFGIDLFSELERILGAFEPLVLDGTLRELERLGAGCGKDASAARVGRILAERCTIVRAPSPKGSVDERIVWYAQKSRCVVVTNDGGLKDMLREHGIRVIGMRKKKTLEISG
jgi:rRNA-processing protein FCF1